MLSLLTVNIGAAALDRADRVLHWVAERPVDVLLLTETSAGPGTAHLINRFTAAGHAVRHAPQISADRGTALITAVPVARDLSEYFRGVSLPARLVAVELATDPPVAIVGMYVPNRDRSLDKTEKKRTFITSVLAALDRLPAHLRHRLVIGGDYNVIPRTHQPLHPGFLPFEFDLLDALHRHDMVDAHDPRSPGQPHRQEYSWVGRTGDGYRYDYFHVARPLSDRIAECTYLHETRHTRLTDHSALALHLRVDVPARLPTSDPRKATAEYTLF